MSNFSERVSRILAENELTIIQFCRKIGLSSQTTISKIISENRKPSSKTFGRILKGFPEVNYQWLINGEGEMTKAETSRVKGLPMSMSNDDDLTVTSKQVIKQLDINNLHYTAILDKKMRDDRDYYDNDSTHVKNIASILEGFKSLEEKIQAYAVIASNKVVKNLLTQANGLEKKFDALEEKMDANATRRAADARSAGEKMDKSNQSWTNRAEEKHAYWHKENKEQKDLFLLTLDKVLNIEQDLENIKSFMADGFENEAIKKADKKTAKKLLTKKLDKKNI